MSSPLSWEVIVQVRSSTRSAWILILLLRRHDTASANDQKLWTEKSQIWGVLSHQPTIVSGVIISMIDIFTRIAFNQRDDTIDYTSFVRVQFRLISSPSSFEQIHIFTFINQQVCLSRFIVTVPFSCAFSSSSPSLSIRFSSSTFGISVSMFPSKKTSFHCRRFNLPAIIKSVRRMKITGVDSVHRNSVCTSCAHRNPWSIRRFTCNTTATFISTTNHGSPWPSGTAPTTKISESSAGPRFSISRKRLDFLTKDAFFSFFFLK